MKSVNIPSRTTKKRILIFTIFYFVVALVLDLLVFFVVRLNIISFLNILYVLLTTMAKIVSYHLVGLLGIYVLGLLFVIAKFLMSVLDYDSALDYLSSINNTDLTFLFYIMPVCAAFIFGIFCPLYSIFYE
ncbi:MAG: hypothetical protein JW811_07880 [Clostridiales bacterium]|nr:hypothetical protein [Clostridiales bacterium]